MIALCVQRGPDALGARASLDARSWAMLCAQSRGTELQRTLILTAPCGTTMACIGECDAGEDAGGDEAPGKVQVSPTMAARLNLRCGGHVQAGLRRTMPLSRVVLEVCTEEGGGEGAPASVGPAPPFQAAFMACAGFAVKMPTGGMADVLECFPVRLGQVTASTAVLLVKKPAVAAALPALAPAPVLLSRLAAMLPREAAVQTTVNSCTAEGGGGAFGAAVDPRSALLLPEREAIGLGLPHRCWVEATGHLAQVLCQRPEECGGGLALAAAPLWSQLALRSGHAALPSGTVRIRRLEAEPTLAARVTLAQVATARRVRGQGTDIRRRLAAYFARPRVVAVGDVLMASSDGTAGCMHGLTPHRRAGFRTRRRLSGRCAGAPGAGAVGC